jgi:hypothetical protein
MQSTTRRRRGRTGTLKRRNSYSFRRRRGMRRRAIWRAVYPALCATAVIGFNYAACANPMASGELTLTAPAPSGPWPITITVPGLTVFDATLPDGDILDIEDTGTALELTAAAGLDLAGTIELDGVDYPFAGIPFSHEIFGLGQEGGSGIAQVAALAVGLFVAWILAAWRHNRSRRLVVTEIVAKDRARLFMRTAGELREGGRS